MVSHRQAESMGERVSDSDGKLLPTGKHERNKDRLVLQATGEWKA